MNREEADRAEPIDVYCDDERHARGKVAHVTQLVPVGVANRYFWTNIGPRKQTRRDRQRRSAEGSPAPHRGMYTRHDSGEPSHVFPCPLCPRRPALDDEHLQALADALAARGDTRVSLATLDTYAARL